jgi:hypothetical protein
MNHSIQYSFEDAPNSQPLLGKKWIQEMPSRLFISQKREGRKYSIRLAELT